MVLDHSNQSPHVQLFISAKNFSLRVTFIFPAYSDCAKLIGFSMQLILSR